MQRKSSHGASDWRAFVLAVARSRLVVVSTVVLGAGGLGLFLGSWHNLCATCPSIARIETWEPDQASKLLAHDGRPVVELGLERRTPVSINALPEHVPQAVVAIEDKRFYSHRGYDPRGIARAAVGVLTFRNLGGGSTITQQLARNMFESEVGFARRIKRKLRELQVALQLEESYTKDQILEAYLNEVYMGPVWGFQAAAQAYFGKNLQDVNEAEAALLAAILNLPGNYNPYRRPENALRRRNLVLDRMAEQGYLTSEGAAGWKEWPLPSEDHSHGGIYGPAPYFEEWVRQILVSRFGLDEVNSGGLRVYTTLDLDMQEAAAEAMKWGWERIEDDPRFRHPRFAEYDTVTAFSRETPYLQGALVALDPRTGHVRAMVGGRDFVQSKFDRARLAHRQAGSGFKPFVYAAAIQSGIPASHVVVDAPVVYPKVDGTEWRPSNYDPEFLGPITIRHALRRSINMVAIKLGWEEVGIESVAQLARRMGIQTEIERFPSTTIGAVEVIPLEVAQAYSTFATLGTRVRPFPILRVENAAGEVVWEPQPERTVVMDSLAARIMVDLLQEAANNGTGYNHRGIGELPYEVPTAGKTGTTNDATDVWFTAFTPNLLATVWFGMDRPARILRGATGGGMAAPVWGRFARHVYYGMEPAEAEASETPLGSVAPDSVAESGVPAALPIPDRWPIPPELTTRQVDRRTGKLWSPWCRDPGQNRYRELYIPGTEPTEFCDDSGPRILRVRGRR